jgi:hypothetical protein
MYMLWLTASFKKELIKGMQMITLIVRIEVKNTNFREMMLSGTNPDTFPSGGFNE